MKASWGAGEKWEPTQEELPTPNPKHTGSFPDCSGSQDPSKPLPAPARGLLTTHPTLGYHVPVSKSSRHLICQISHICIQEVP
jgi:hypothetical protein